MDSCKNLEELIKVEIKKWLQETQEKSWKQWQKKAKKKKFKFIKLIEKLFKKISEKIGKEVKSIMIILDSDYIIVFYKNEVHWHAYFQDDVMHSWKKSYISVDINDIISIFNSLKRASNYWIYINC